MWWRWLWLFCGHCKEKKRRLYAEEKKTERLRTSLEEERRRGRPRLSTVGTVCLTTRFSHAVPLLPWISMILLVSWLSWINSNIRQLGRNYQIHKSPSPRSCPNWKILKIYLNSPSNSLSPLFLNWLMIQPSSRLWQRSVSYLVILPTFPIWRHLVETRSGWTWTSFVVRPRSYLYQIWREIQSCTD